MKKPVAIFRHTPTEGPGYFATFLDRHSIPWTLIRVDENEAIPGNATAFSGLVFMGGPMSVNDDLPWIAPTLDLIRDSAARDIPVLGHCLGGQLMAKALGGSVSVNPIKEIGWGQVNVSDNAAAKWWCGDASSLMAFHWHGETFTLPHGATHILSSPYCVNQGFVLGRHLALQCHVEMTHEMIAVWCEIGAQEMAASNSPAVQTRQQIFEEEEINLEALNKFASHLYERWISGLVF